MLLRFSGIVFPRCVQTFTPISKSVQLRLWPSTFSFLQVAPIVSVSGLEAGINLRVMTHVLFELPEESTTFSAVRAQTGLNSCPSTQELSDCPESCTGQKPEYLSLLFREDDEPADVAWTFAVRDGEDLIDILERYAWTMRRDISNE